MSNVIGNLHVVLGLDTAAFQQGLSQATAGLRKAGETMRGVGQKLSLGLTAPLAGFAGMTIKTAADFETAMNQVAAVSGATGADLEALTKQARELGAVTQFSASQAADAMGFLAMAGYRTDEVLAAMPHTLKLASAAQLEMGQAADIVTNILSGYGKEVSELGNVTDVLVNAFTSSNTNLVQLGEAMTYAGPVASAAGVEFEETAAAFGMMGGAGIQASMAGTSLRGAIARALSPTKKMASIMEENGLAFTDAQGRLLPLVDIIEQLEPHAEDAGLMMELFGQRAGPAMAALVSKGSDELRGFRDELRESGGVADRVSAVQMQGFKGAMKQLTSAFQELQLTIANTGLLDFMTQLVRRLAAFVSYLSDTNPELLRWGVILGAVAAALGPVLIALGAMLAGLGPILSGLGLLVTVFKGIAVVVAGLGAPFAVLVAAIAGAAYLIWDNWETVGPWFKDLLTGIGDMFVDLSETVVDIVENGLGMALDGLKQAWSGLTGFFETLLAGVVAAFEWAVEKIRPLIDWLAEAVEKVDGGLNKITGATKGPISSGAYTGGATDPVLPPQPELPEGLAAGTKGMGDLGRSDARGYADGFRDEMDIRSPSRVMMEIGTQLSEGLAIGISDGADLVGSEADRLSGSLQTSLVSGLEGIITGTMTAKQAFASMLSDMVSRLLSSGLNGIVGSLFGSLNIPGFATGVEHFRGGMATINERGGELAIMPSGSTVIPHDLSKRMLDGQAGGAVDVRVTVGVDPDNGNLQGYVDQRAGAAVQAGIGHYDRNILPKSIGRASALNRERTG